MKSSGRDCYGNSERFVYRSIPRAITVKGDGRRVNHRCRIHKHHNRSVYSPAAKIRNAKIWNIILFLAFFQTFISNLDLEYPAVSEENCLKNLLPLP